MNENENNELTRMASEMRRRGETPETGWDSIAIGVDDDVKVIIFLAIVAFFVGAFYLIRYLFRKFKTMNIRSKTIGTIIKKADAKIKKRELLSLKAELAREHKSIDDYSSEEINLILLDKREKVVSKIKDKSLLGLLIALIIGI